MTTIVSTRAYLIDIPVETPRTDAVQAFLKQETIFVHLETSDKIEGIGYSYTIGTGGTSVLSMLRDYMLPELVGLDSDRIEHIWNSIYYSTRATTTGVITSLAIAAIDTALWDIRGKRTKLPLWKLVGGFSSRIPLYDTEGGWLHIDKKELVESALASKGKKLTGVKIKIGKPDATEDLERLMAVRKSLGANFNIMVDANQSMTLAESKKRVKLFEQVGLFWIEEPMPADDVQAHSELVKFSSIPIAVGESIYSLGQFHQYMQRGAADYIQVDVARVGGITPWLKVAHLAEAFNIMVCPHFLMEIHVSLAAGVSNGLYVEYIPQLTAVTNHQMAVEDGWAIAPSEHGLGISWNFESIEKLIVS